MHSTLVAALVHVPSFSDALVTVVPAGMSIFTVTVPALSAAAL